MLQDFGFDQKICKLISQLISTSSLAILVNGAPLDFFQTFKRAKTGGSSHVLEGLLRRTNMRGD